MAKVVSLR